MKKSCLPAAFCALLSLLLLTGCQDEAQFRALNEQIRALESSQGQSKAELNRLQIQMRSLQLERDKIKEERDKLQSQIDEAQKALESIQKDFEEYKNQYRLSIRRRAPGMELDVVEIDGKRFEKVKIRELTEESLTFMHQAGTMSVNLSQLKPDMQERFGYQKAAPVMALTRDGVRNQGGVELDHEVRMVENRLLEVRKEMGDLQRKLVEANHAVKIEENKREGGNPTLHQQAVAALRVKLNQLEVEHQNLTQRSRELSHRVRMNQLRVR